MMILVGEPQHGTANLNCRQQPLYGLHVSFQESKVHYLFKGCTYRVHGTSARCHQADKSPSLRIIMVV